MICNDCGAAFGAPVVRKDGEAVCPNCGGLDYSKAKPCKCCNPDGLPCRSWLPIWDDLDICTDCLETAVERFEIIIRTVFTPDEIYALNMAYEHRPFGMAEKEAKSG